ncbi:MAG: hypothetical protein D3912_08460, partial [Candidatus Electrothrix sp. AX1]|nr:hypothetical protein [Candidatus Electrothrix sp. AX1]
MSSFSLESALVRLLIDEHSPRKPVGAGFLVTPTHVVTCAHVVNDALGYPQGSLVAFKDNSSVVAGHEITTLHPGQPGQPSPLETTQV